MFATNSGQLKIHSKPTTENRFMVSVFGSFLHSLRSLRNDNYNIGVSRYKNDNNFKGYKEYISKKWLSE